VRIYSSVSNCVEKRFSLGSAPWAVCGSREMEKRALLRRRRGGLKRLHAARGISIAPSLKYKHNSIGTCIGRSAAANLENQPVHAKFDAFPLILRYSLRLSSLSHLRNNTLGAIRTTFNLYLLSRPNACVDLLLFALTNETESFIKDYNRIISLCV